MTTYWTLRGWLCVLVLLVPSISLAGTVESGGGGGGDVAIIDGAVPSIKATVKDYVNSKPMAIIPVDTNGDPASLSGGTQYSQGTAATDTDQLTMLGCVRADTAAAATGVANLDRARCIVDAAGRIWIRPTGSVTPSVSFTNPTDAITVWSLNGCSNADTTWSPCPKASAGAGTTDSTTPRTTEATDSQLSTDIAAIKTAVQLIDDDQTGASIKHFVTAGTTEDENEVKGSAGRLLSVQATNTAATVAFLRCADQVAASTTPGTTAVKWGMAVPGATTGAGVVANFGPMGIAFTTGITCWVVGGEAETDVAEVAANKVQVNIQYK